MGNATYYVTESAKRFLRRFGIEVQRLPASGLPLRDRLHRAVEGFGFRIVRSSSPTLVSNEEDAVEAQLIEQYLSGGRIPYSAGYDQYRRQYLSKILSNAEQVLNFATRAQLPDGYGHGLDERCVEYPWFFSKASRDARRYLDAGSAMNHAYILSQQFWRDRDVTIVTLKPERQSFWDHGISYQFADLRELPFRDCWFDEIACLSTLEHVGMDASVFTHDTSDREHNRDDFATALVELCRVLKPGGVLLFSVPYGKYQDLGWLQQFDAALLEQCSEAFQPSERDDYFFRYFPGGWQVANQDECSDCVYAEWSPNLAKHPPEDLAANARAVACCAWTKRGA